MYLQHFFLCFFEKLAHWEEMLQPEKKDFVNCFLVEKIFVSEES